MIEIQKHITEEMWTALKDDTIGQEDFLNILEHTCNCTYCADLLAHSMDDREGKGVEPPAYLKDEIMELTRMMNVKAALCLSEASKKVQLMLYSLKVGLAVALSVFVLILTSNLQNINFKQIEQPRQQKQQESVTDKLSDAANMVSDKLNELSNFILNGGK